MNQKSFLFADTTVQGLTERESTAERLLHQVSLKVLLIMGFVVTRGSRYRGAAGQLNFFSSSLYVGTEGTIYT